MSKRPTRIYKFLHPCGCTIWGDEPFIYALPGPGEEWGPWNTHPNPAQPDGTACGPGRLHVMKGLYAFYAPASWWPWDAEGRGLIGEDAEKAAYGEVRLRRILPQELWRRLREGEGQGGNLWRADLRGVDLTKANLTGANLTWAILIGANLKGADLTGADLRGVDLTRANLSGAIGGPEEER